MHELPPEMWGVALTAALHPEPSTITAGLLGARVEDRALDAHTVQRARLDRIEMVMLGLMAVHGLRLEGDTIAMCPPSSLPHDVSR